MAQGDPASELATLRKMVKLQSQVCFMNVDRTLSTWTRTALSLIVLGAVVDRYGLLLTRSHLAHVGTRLAPNPISSIGAVILVALGIFIVVAAAVRHQAYGVMWKRVYLPLEHPQGPWLAFPFAVMVAVVGVAILVVLLACVW